MSKQSASRQKINRYIYIMNEISQQKVINNYQIQAAFLIRNMIIIKEKGLGIGKIDRKTIDPILRTLEKIPILHQVYKDID
jgi:hypothetical protein